MRETSDHARLTKQGSEDCEVQDDSDGEVLSLVVTRKPPSRAHNGLMDSQTD